MIQTMFLTALVCLPAGILIGMRRSPPIYADPEGFHFDGVMEARGTNTDSDEISLTLRSDYMKKPNAYVSISVAHDDPAGKRFAEHVEKKQKFLVKVEAAK